MIRIELRGRGPNTMSVPMLERLEADLDAARGEPVLVTGHGRAFSAGLDLDALEAMDGAGVRDLLVTIERVTLKLFLHPAPTVASIHGHAVAGGCLVAQATDLRLAAADPTLRIGMTGVAIGLRYPPFVFDILRARLPRAHLETVLLGAGRCDVHEALARGLVDRVVAPDQVEAAAIEALAELAAVPRAAYASAKLSLRAPLLTAVADRDAFLDEVVPTWTGSLARLR